MNNLKLGLLMTGLIVLFILIGQAIGGREGATVALFISLGMNFISYWYSDRIILNLFRARPLSYSEAPELFMMLEDISRAASIPVPRLYLVESASPNAFATGRNPENAAVAVTTGLLNILDRRELAAVLAHEVGHIVNRDTLITTIVAGIAGAIFFLADMARWAMIFGGYSRDQENQEGLSSLLLVIFAPIAAMLLQMAISRTREYKADRTSALLLRDGEPLASALLKIHNASRRAVPFHSPATSALMIYNPFSGQSLLELMSTHPSLENRIAALREVQEELMRS